MLPDPKYLAITLFVFILFGVIAVIINWIRIIRLERKLISSLETNLLLKQAKIVLLSQIEQEFLKQQKNGKEATKTDSKHPKEGI